MMQAGSRVAAVTAAVATGITGILVFWLAVRLPALGADDPAKTAATVPFVIGMMVLALTGALLVRGSSRPLMGWLMLGTGLAGVGGRLVLGLAVVADESGHGLAADALGWMTNWAWLPAQGLALLLVLRFPDGELPGPRWRAVQHLVVGWTVVGVAVTAVLPGPLGAEQLAPRTNPLGAPASAGALDVVLAAVFAAQPVLLLLAVAAPVLRWRRGGAEERKQLAVVGRALLLLAVAAPLAIASDAGVVLEGLAWLVLPMSITYAVLRHGLWDLDVRRRLDRLRAVREEERTRLQRELHDSLGPMLGSIGLRAEAARNLVAAQAPAADIDDVLVSIGADSERAVVEVRRFIDELGPSALAEGDLATALEQLAADYATAGLAVTVTGANELPTLDPAAEIALYRVAGEALRNVHRHARASRCHVAVRVDGVDVVLEVVDDGIGLRGSPPGVGRRGMADRVAAVGGVLAIDEPAEGGVHLRACLADAVR